MSDSPNYEQSSSETCWSVSSLWNSPGARWGIVLILVLIGSWYIALIDGSWWSVRAYDATAWWIVLSLCAVVASAVTAFVARKHLHSSIAVLLSVGAGGLTTLAASSAPGMIVGLLVGVMVAIDPTRQLLLRLTRTLLVLVLPAGLSGIMAGLVGSITYFHFDGRGRWFGVALAVALLIASLLVWTKRLKRTAHRLSRCGPKLHHYAAFCLSALLCVIVGVQLDTLRRCWAVRDHVRIELARVPPGPRMLTRGFWDVEWFWLLRDSTDEDVEYVRGFPFTSWAAVFPRSKVTDKGLPRLELARTLHFECSNNLVTDDGIRFLGNYPQLTHLQFEGARITDEGLVILKQKPNLAQLALPNTSIDGSSLSKLDPGCPLSFVDLSHTRVNDRALAHLRSFSLEDVRLRGTPIDGEGLKHIAASPRLRFLDLSHSKVREEHLDLLASSTSLDTLVLKGIPLTVRGMESISRICSLAHLDITETDIDDASLKPLQKNRKLHSLCVQANQLTPAGYAFIAHLPMVFLEYDASEMSLTDIARNYQALVGAATSLPSPRPICGFTIRNLAVSPPALPKLTDLELRYDLILRSPRIKGKTYDPDKPLTLDRIRAILREKSP